MDIIPIWKDYPITIATTADYVDYTITMGADSGTVIYSGRAYKLPGATAVVIIPNEVCAPYVAVTGAVPIPDPIPPDDDPDSFERFTAEGMTREFTLTEANGTAHPFVFQADYSHVIPLHATPAPINGKVDRKQVILASFYTTRNGRVYYGIYDQRGRGEEGYAFAEGYSTCLLLRGKVLQKAARIVMYAQNTPAVAYDVVDECLPYTLYYVNAFGGWDSLIVDGAVKKTDDYDRTTFKQAYLTVPQVNGVLERGTVCLQNDITRKYTLVTGWLTDDQASRMHHLLGSTNVYLRDADTNEYLPVVLTNSSCEYKTYRNNGAQLVNYTIEATVAQNYVRR